MYETTFSIATDDIKEFDKAVTPRKSMCKHCPHRYNIKTKSCADEDRFLWDLGKPHVCTWHPEYLCRGCTEKFKMNGLEWSEGVKA